MWSKVKLTGSAVPHDAKIDTAKAAMGAAMDLMLRCAMVPSTQAIFRRGLEDAQLVT